MCDFFDVGGRARSDGAPEESARRHQVVDLSR
ncbi:hypothetical protein OKW29_004407, partial [Paraburkholderia sp. CI3]